MSAWHTTPVTRGGLVIFHLHHTTAMPQHYIYNAHGRLLVTRVHVQSAVAHVYRCMRVCQVNSISARVSS